MRTRKSADARRQEILKATLQLAAELGPDRVTTGAVAARVGLTQPGVFRHFPSKQALWEELARHIGELLRAQWDALPAEGEPLARLEALWEAQLRMISANPALPAILFSRELHGDNASLRRGLQQVLEAFRGRLAERVAAAQAAGVLRRSLVPDRAALLLISLIQGLTLRWSLFERRFDLLTEGRELLTLTLTGLMAPGRRKL